MKLLELFEWLSFIELSKVVISLKVRPLFILYYLHTHTHLQVSATLYTPLRNINHDISFKPQKKEYSNEFYRLRIINAIYYKL